MSENDRTDARDLRPRISEVETGLASRRNVLKTGAAALAGGSLLTAGASESAAAQDGGALDVRTTDVDVLSDGQDAEVRTSGRVSGMSNFDCERCEVGAHVRPVGGDRWYGGLQTIEHPAGDSFRAGVTLAGLRPGRYECRLCACPITRTDVFVANVLLVVIEGKDDHDDHHHDCDGHHDDYHDCDDDHHDGHHGCDDGLDCAYRKTCPCDLSHSGWCHVLFHGGNASNPLDYAFRLSRRGVRQVGVTNAPHAIPSRHVTVDTEEEVHGTVVRGGLAGGGDSFLCRGRFTDVRIEQGVSVYVNGHEVTDVVDEY